MIFVTIGTQMHFDRLIAAVDEWAGLTGTKDVFAQTGPSSYLPRYIKAKPFITPQEFRDCVHHARIMVSHAGMGSILTALEFGKRIVVMPRNNHLGEHRSDHQIATARYFASQGRVLVAADQQELFVVLNQLDNCDEIEPISPTASPILIATIRQFVESKHQNLTDRRVIPHGEMLRD
jgi:UDP-N-acetylglucosamine transferase subunit ALG13